MAIELRLRHLLKLDQPGHKSIKELAEEMDLSTFQLNSLLNNDTPTINRVNLEKVVKYMKTERLVPADDLPEALFAYEPSKFWQMISERTRVLLCMGVRWDPTWRANVVMAADSMLQSNLLYGLTGVADSAGRRRGRGRRKPNQIIDSQTVPAWGKHRSKANAAVQQAALAFYTAYQSEPNDKALICLGSIKSNPAIEPVISNTFKGLSAFKRQERVRVAQDRGCPFALIVRPGDPNPPSNSCGKKLSARQAGTGPGVYYEMESGQWEYARCDTHHDVAIVFYRLDRVKENLEMVLGGFSGYSTRMLARLLRESGDDLFWPPSYESADMYIGISIVKFLLLDGASSRRRADADEWESCEVVDIPGEVIARRLD